ncbi:hypothetical protein PAAG_11302 [Paracoccidioides lutzii Pb01]|uniref:Uncharacterized protein n=1 Tax=Paracoccidioides lutzii (strain ATCC MYA-826 / Pb01) TaxID=502779 RepID=A0A0A2V6D4_PARBA|nr:hypothetical protein PAAG_11302 [Paracoccidioides lutzii Pb01]KGQ01912.1 hypothetical protein PAAG_11302 [Paracoccidioides lutzii Pb01]
MLANGDPRISSEANGRVKRPLLLDAPPGNKLVLFDSLLRPCGDKILVCMDGYTVTFQISKLEIRRPKPIVGATSLVTSYGNRCLDNLKALNVGCRSRPPRF